MVPPSRSEVRAAGTRRARFSRPSARARRPVRDRKLGALLLFRQCRAGRSLHGEISARARPGRDRARLRRGQGGARIPVRAPRPAAARFADFRLLYRAGVFHAGSRRPHRRPPARPASDRHRRWRADGDRPFHDGVRDIVSGRPVDAHSRHRRVQAEHLDPGRLSLPARRRSARPRLLDLLSRHQYRGVPGAAGLRHPRRPIRMARGIWCGRHRDVGRSRHLPWRPADVAARPVAESKDDSPPKRNRSTPASAAPCSR